MQHFIHLLAAVRHLLGQIDVMLVRHFRPQLRFPDPVLQLLADIILLGLDVRQINCQLAADNVRQQDLLDMYLRPILSFSSFLISSWSSRWKSMEAL